MGQGDWDLGCFESQFLDIKSEAYWDGGGRAATVKANRKFHSTKSVGLCFQQTGENQQENQLFIKLKAQRDSSVIRE